MAIKSKQIKEEKMEEPPDRPIPSADPDPKFKRFYLIRKKDISGVSGCGKVAEGIQFTDGSCCIRWLSTTTSTGMYHSIVELEYIHSHKGDGGTVVVFCD